MELSSKIVFLVLCLLFSHFSFNIGYALVMVDEKGTNSSETDDDSINVEQIDNSEISNSEPNLQYVDNDVNIPPVTDTGPILNSETLTQVNDDKVISDNEQISEEKQIDDDLMNILDRNINKKEDLVIDIGFNDALSLNSGLSDGLTDSVFPAVVSLVDDTATQEFQNENLENDLEFLQKNSSKSNISNITSPSSIETETNDTIVDLINEHVEYIVKAEPKVILHVTTENDGENTTITQDELNIPQDQLNKTLNEQEVIQNTDVDETKNTIPILDSESNRPKPSETMPVFSEWAQKQLEEAEKINKASVNISNNNKPGTHMNKTVKNTAITAKNYASPDCNAKIIAANPESSSMASVLSPLRDEYALNTCTSKIWFIVELCESIQARRIDLANFELFSSSPKDFTVYTSARFPSRDWTNLGQFTAKDERVIQSFDLEHSTIFGKYVKVEIQTHYGKEHFCPVSLFRVYGTSEFEAFETENPVHNTHIDLLEDEDADSLINNVQDGVSDETKNQTELNLFGSARDAVMSIMKKAAEVLTKSVDSNINSKNTSIPVNNTAIDNKFKKNCRTPSHIIVCDNCSDLLYSDLYEILSCCNHKLDKFVKNRLIRRLIHNTDVCLKYGLDFTSSAKVSLRENATLMEFFDVFFARKYQAALCNAFAILENKVVLNISASYDDKNADILLVDNNKTPIVLETNTLLPLPANQANNLINQKIADDGLILTENDNKNMIIDDVNQREDVVLENNAEIINNIKEDVVQSEQTDFTQNVDASKNILQNNGQDVINGNLEDENLTQIVQVNEENVQDNLNLQNNNGDSLIEDQNEIMQEDNAGLLKDGQQMTNENFENIFIDLVDTPAVVNDTLPATVNSVNTVNNAAAVNNANTQNVPKETILIRLSNRIKALERNMSLSGQYLEELSRRYRNKVEELHLAFDSMKTQISDEIRTRIAQDELKTQQITQLRDQIAYLTNELRIISEDKQSWTNRLWFASQFIVVISIIVYIAAELFWYKNKTRLEDLRYVKKKRVVNSLKRRKSVEGVSGHHLITKNLRRRPSTEALNISGTYKDLLVTQDGDLNDDNKGEWFLVTSKNNGDRRRKRKKVQKSLSLGFHIEHQKRDLILKTTEDVMKNNIEKCLLNDANTCTQNTESHMQNTDKHAQQNAHMQPNSYTHTQVQNLTDNLKISDTENDIKIPLEDNSNLISTNTSDANNTKLTIDVPDTKFPARNFLRSTLSYRSSRKKKTKIDRNFHSLQEEESQPINPSTNVGNNNKSWDWYRRKKTANNLENGGNFSAENLSEDLNTSVSTIQDDVSLNSSVNDKSQSKNKTYLKRIFKRVF